MQQLINKYPQGRILIIGSGSSAAKVIPYANKLHGFFDAVIGLNGVFRKLDHVLDYHLVLEKDFFDLPILTKFNFNTQIPRLINYKSIHKYPTQYNLQPVTRLQRPDAFNPREFIPNTPTALLAGPVKDGLSTGTVLLQAIHLASVLGASCVYLIGADLCFSSPHQDHFYTAEKRYRNRFSKHPNAAVPITHNGLATTDQFLEGAKTLDHFISTDFSSLGFIDFSGGLLEKPIKSDFTEFAKKVLVTTK